MARRPMMTPEMVVEALKLAAKGTTLKDAIVLLGVPRSTLQAWSKRHKVRFADGRCAVASRPGFRRSEAFIAAARKNAAKATVAAAAKSRLPLTDEERATYNRIRREGAGIVTRDDALRAIGRADLVGVTA